MVNYKNGKIYKLVNDELNLTYYGSTCNELRKRLSGHKTKKNICTSKIMFESGEVKIYLVEKFPCNDRLELNQRERYYIENNECINKCIPNRTKKEWIEVNKKNIAKQKKEYREINKEQIKEQRKRHYQENKEQKKEDYKKNREKILEYRKRHYQENRDKILVYRKRHYQINK